MKLSESKGCPSIIQYIPKKFHNLIPFYNIILLSVASCLFFACFSTTQSILSTLYEEIGYYSLAILYIVFSVGNFIAPSIENVLSPKTSLILGGIPYAIFVLSAGIPWELGAKIALLINGALTGMGAALFWVAHGDFIVRNSRFLNKNRMGLFSGLFFSIFSMNGFAGNLANALMMRMNIPQWLLFCILAIIACIGVSLLGFLIPVPAPPSQVKTFIEGNIEEDNVEEGYIGEKAKVPNLKEVYEIDDTNISSEQIFEETLQNDLPNTDILSEKQGNEKNNNQIESMKDTETGGISTMQSELIQGSKLNSESVESFGSIENGTTLLNSPTSPTYPNSPNSPNSPIALSDMSSKNGRFSLSNICIRVLKKVLLSTGQLIAMFLDKKMLLFMPISLYSGATLGFFQGSIPPLFGKNFVPWVMAGFSLSSGIFAALLGQLSRILSKRILMTITLFLHMISLILTMSIRDVKPYSYFWTMAVCGMADAALNTMIYAYLGTYFEAKSAEGFAVFKFEQSLSASIAFFCGSLLEKHFNITLIIMLVLLSIALVSFLILEYFFSPVDRFTLKKKNLKIQSPVTEDMDYGTTGTTESVSNVSKADSYQFSESKSPIESAVSSSEEFPYK